MGVTSRLRNLGKQMYVPPEPPETISNLPSEYKDKLEKLLEEMKNREYRIVELSQGDIYNRTIIETIRRAARDYVRKAEKVGGILSPYDQTTVEKFLKGLNEAYENLTEKHEYIGRSVRGIKRGLEYLGREFGKLNLKYKAVVAAAITGILAYKGGYKFYMKYLAPLFDNSIHSFWEKIIGMLTPHIDIPPYEAKGITEKTIKPVVDQLQTALENALNSAIRYTSEKSVDLATILTQNILAIVWPLIAIGGGIGAISLYTKLDEKKRRRKIQNFIELTQKFNDYLEKVCDKYETMKKSHSQREPTQPTQEILKETPKEVQVIDEERIKSKIEEGIKKVYREIRNPDEAKRRLEELFKEMMEKYGINEDKFKKILSMVNIEGIKGE
jgi:hypothetical protein